MCTWRNVVIWRKITGYICTCSELGNQIDNALCPTKKMYSCSIDFTLAFPQADTDVDIFMELPIGVNVPKGEVRKDYVLYLLRNIYGLKQASITYFEYLCGYL